MDSDWSNLREHLLFRVLDKLKNTNDWVTFNSVCHAWCVAMNYNKDKIVKFNKHRAPVLLVPNYGIKHDEWSVYSVTSNTFLQTNLLLPPYNRLLSGSSEGWLVTLDKKFKVTLYKPFDLSATIHLPPLFRPTLLPKRAARFRQFHIFGIATFTPDLILSPKDFICAVICGPYEQLAYIRITKDSEWTRVISPETTTYDDIIWYNGRFYANTVDGKLVSFNVDEDQSETRARLVAGELPEEDEDHSYKSYLVESYEGELMQVSRYYVPPNRLTTKFKVFKLVNCKDGQMDWTEVKSLGESALFLGENESISVLASSFPGCQNDSIYFSHDKILPLSARGPCDFGVYNLKTGIVTRRFTIEETEIVKMRRRAPLFVLP